MSYLPHKYRLELTLYLYRPELFTKRGIHYSNRPRIPVKAHPALFSGCYLGERERWCRPANGPAPPPQMMRQILNETFCRPINLSTSGRRLEGGFYGDKNTRKWREVTSRFWSPPRFLLSVRPRGSGEPPLRGAADSRVHKFFPDALNGGSWRGTGQTAK